MAKKVGRVQFYGNDKSGTRRIFSFKVTSQSMAIDALTRMNVQAGWYLPDENRRYSVKIQNPYYSPASISTGIWDRIDKFLALD
jgi:hypothetical protein